MFAKFRHNAIARNTLWNFLGVAIAAPIALVSIPPLVTGLGGDLFGLLTIGWTVMGYFSLFDLGVGRATTKYLAEARHRSNLAVMRQLVWSSLAIHVALGVLGGLLLFAITPLLLSILRVPPDLTGQARLTFYVLALSVPIIVITAAARGVLEGMERFDLVNVVKVPANAFTYAGPLLALSFTRELPAMVALIAAGRAVALAVYLAMCVTVLPAIRTPEAPRLAIVKPLMLTGGWLTAATLVPPILVAIDRFVIGAVVSVAALTSYVAPYEVVTKLWILSASLLGVLFPAFSIAASNPQQLRLLYSRALVILYLLATPLAGLVIAFAPEFFTLWLGADIARDAVPVARWLALGVWVNVIAQVPWTMLQATDHADITGKLQLSPLPFYVAAAVFGAQQWGIIGVAMVWSARAFLDALLLFWAVSRRLRHLHECVFPRDVLLAAASSALMLGWCWKASELPPQWLAVKAALVLLGVGIFTYGVWRQRASAVIARLR